METVVKHKILTKTPKFLTNFRKISTDADSKIYIRRRIDFNAIHQIFKNIYKLTVGIPIGILKTILIN